MAKIIFLILISSLSFAKDISFSHFNWKIKDGYLLPGKNEWCNDDKSVFTDELGFLHLKVRKLEKSWCSTSVSIDNPLGYGIYEWTLTGPIDKTYSDPNLVIGLFLYQDDFHEYDIEISNWHGEHDKNTQFVIQPSDKENHFHRFDSNIEKDQDVTYRMIWTADNISFEEIVDNQILQSWEYLDKENLITPKRGKLILNYWMYRGQSPADLKDHELVIKKFQFHPQK